MPKAIPLARREQVVQGYVQGTGSVNDIAARFGLNRSTVVRLVQRQRAGRSLAPVEEHRGGRVPLLDAEDLAWLKEHLPLAQDLRHDFIEWTPPAMRHAWGARQPGSASAR